MNDSPLDPSRSTLLDLKLDALRYGLAREAAPPAIEAQLLERFRIERRARTKLVWLPGLALAAALALVSWVVLALHPADPAPAVPYRESADAGPFLALRPLDRIALEPAPRVVQSQFPRALLAQWGLPVAPERAAEPVHAELLYSAAGEPLAVRLVQ
jgi:hypothetical protein